MTLDDATNFPRTREEWARKNDPEMFYDEDDLDIQDEQPSPAKMTQSKLQEPPNNSIGYEMAARLLKIVIFIGSLFIWGGLALGIYSIYRLWTTDPAGDLVLANVQSSLELGWIAIGLIVVVRMVTLAIAWALLTPIEARIRGINLRDPEVAKSIRESDRTQFIYEGISLLAYVAVPLLIAHFRFNYFN